MQELDLLQHFPVFASYSKGDLKTSISFKHASQLLEDERTSVWDIFEANMKDMYQADNQKWHPKEKRRELFDVSPCLMGSPPPHTHTTCAPPGWPVWLLHPTTISSTVL